MAKYNISSIATRPLHKKHLERLVPTTNYKYLDHLDLIAHNPMTKSQMHVNHISLLRKYK